MSTYKSFFSCKKSCSYKCLRWVVFIDIESQSKTKHIHIFIVSIFYLILQIESENDSTLKSTMKNDVKRGLKYKNLDLKLNNEIFKVLKRLIILKAIIND